MLTGISPVAYMSTTSSQEKIVVGKIREFLKEYLKRILTQKGFLAVFTPINIVCLWGRSFWSNLLVESCKHNFLFSFAMKISLQSGRPSVPLPPFFA